MTDDLQLAVNRALDDTRLSRLRSGLLAGGMGLDTKRSGFWCEVGFPEALGFNDFYKLYRRGGIAHGAVNKIVGACWKTSPWVIEGYEEDESRSETAWDKAARELLTPSVWRNFADADMRRLVGRFSGLLIHVRDNKDWDQPVEAKGRGVAKITPVWAGSLKIIEYYTDLKDERYGEPKMWQYTEAATDGSAARQIKVHPDRIFILGDWRADAIGFLEPAYNAFVSLEKVEGGSGESFLKNAARQVSVNFDKEIDFANIASVYGVSVDALQEKFNEAAREINRGNDQMLITQGAQVSPLVSAVSDPTPTYNVNLQTAAAAMDIPTKILVGMQTGERASTEDQRYFNNRCQARRRELSFEIDEMVQRLIRFGLLKPARVAVMWDDLTEQTQADKLANAKTMSEINAQAIATGAAVFENGEIRVAAGYEPDATPLGEETEDDDGEIRDPAVE